MLQCVALAASVSANIAHFSVAHNSAVLQRVAACCSVLQRVAVSGSCGIALAKMMSLSISYDMHITHV